MRMTVFILSRLVSLAALPEGESKLPETYKYQLPLITSLSRRASPPEGSLLIRMKVFILSRLVSLATLPEGESKQPEKYEYRLPLITSLCEELSPSAVGFFALFSSKRKSEKGKPLNEADGFYPLSARFTRHSPRRGKHGRRFHSPFSPEGESKGGGFAPALLKGEIF